MLRSEKFVASHCMNKSIQASKSDRSVLDVTVSWMGQVPAGNMLWAVHYSLTRSLRTGGLL